MLAPPTALCSDYVIAIIQLISANYMGQHTFLEDMSGMESPATFQAREGEGGASGQQGGRRFL